MAFVFCCTLSVNGAPQEKRSPERAAAIRMGEAIRAASLRNVLVADFLDGAGARTDRGVYFAAHFAKELASRSSQPFLSDRWAWFSLLEKIAAAPGDSVQPQGVQRICAALGCDGILSGTWAVATDGYFVSLTLRSASSGEPLASAAYPQSEGAGFRGDFPAASDDSGVRYYFAGLDGITAPKCKSCPNPAYTDKARKRHLQGAVILCGLLGTDGHLRNLTVVKSLEKSLDQSALDQLQRWEFEAAHDPSGKPVPVRLPIEVNFRLQ